MDLFANDLSFHGQFHDISSFRDAFGRLMAMREVSRRYGRDLYCSRSLMSANITRGATMQQVFQRFPEAQRRSALGWMTRSGPFRDDVRRHGPDDYLESQGEVVTESAVGEAAYCNMHGLACGLVSVTPSNWDFSPVSVSWRREDVGLEDRYVEVENWRDVIALEEQLRDASPPLQSWSDVERTATNRFASLTFTNDCFKPLVGLPFAKAASDRILVLLDILHEFVRAFDENGSRTREGHRIYQAYFTGSNALFSDSSDTEKREFRDQLTFPHPKGAGKSLFCTWHGKIRHMTLRLHYSWSEKAGEPIYVVYVGPKITKR